MDRKAAEHEVSEEVLEAGERSHTDHDHAGVEPSEEALGAHLMSDHAVEIPEGLTEGTLRGVHDRFHGEAHATEDEA